VSYDNAQPDEPGQGGPAQLTPNDPQVDTRGSPRPHNYHHASRRRRPWLDERSRRHADAVADRDPDPG
jgi:hypothetical protein